MWNVDSLIPDLNSGHGVQNVKKKQRVENDNLHSVQILFEFCLL